VLTTTIQRFSNRIDGLQGEIQATQQRLDRAHLSLDRQKNQLLEVRDRLEPRATASRACAASWPRLAGCWPPGSWRSTSPTCPMP
jgi:hypothetical protein